MSLATNKLLTKSVTITLNITVHDRYSSITCMYYVLFFVCQPLLRRRDPYDKKVLYYYVEISVSANSKQLCLHKNRGRHKSLYTEV